MTKEAKKHENPMALLLKDLSQFQKNMTGAIKDSINPFHKSSYADLSSVVNAIKSASSDLNIGFYHKTDDDILTTFVFYSDGVNYAELSSSLSIDISGAKNAMQAKGSAITYAKRYTLQGLFGLPSEDDDGQGCEGAQIKKTPPINANQPVLVPFTQQTLEGAKNTILEKVKEGKDATSILSEIMNMTKNKYSFDENMQKIVHDYIQNLIPPI